MSQALQDMGVDSFLAHEDIQLSEEWRNEIISELRRADIFVAILSADFRASEWCSQEVGFTVSRGEVVVIPLSIDGTAPYGFIAAYQGRRVTRHAEVADILLEVLLRKRTHEMIPLQIVKMRGARSFRGAEAVVSTMVPHFANFTDSEVVAFVEATVGNYEVWDAGRCRVNYIPAFVAANRDRIPPELRTRLKEKIEELALE